jgi:queuine tRNA-ribosyltransferase
MLLSWANTAFYQQLMQAMRNAIAEDRFSAWAADARQKLGPASAGVPDQR